MRGIFPPLVCCCVIVVVVRIMQLVNTTHRKKSTRSQLHTKIICLPETFHYFIHIQMNQARNCGDKRREDRLGNEKTINYLPPS